MCCFRKILVGTIIYSLTALLLFSHKDYRELKHMYYISYTLVRSWKSSIVVLLKSIVLNYSNSFNQRRSYKEYSFSKTISEFHTWISQILNFTTYLKFSLRQSWVQIPAPNNIFLLVEWSVFIFFKPLHKFVITE